eukprot:39713-Prymnesium_polylepis.1
MLRATGSLPRLNPVCCAVGVAARSPPHSSAFRHKLNEGRGGAALNRGCRGCSSRASFVRCQCCPNARGTVVAPAPATMQRRGATFHRFP